MACRGERSRRFWSGYVKKSPLERPRHMWRDIINMGLQECGGKMWTVFSWVRTDTNVRSYEGVK